MKTNTTTIANLGNKRKLSIVIPAYKESKRIIPTIRSIAAYKKQVDFAVELIVVEDGSPAPDDTLRVLREQSKQYPFMKVLRHKDKKNHGKGWAVRRGMLAATGTHMVFMDADNATKITEIHDFWPHFDKGYDVVLGSRRVKGANIATPQPFMRELLGRVSNLIIQILVAPGIRDTQAGFKAFSKQAVRQIFTRQTLARWGFDFEVIAIAKKLKLKIVEAPITWNDQGGSTLNPLKAYINTFKELAKVRWNLWTGKYS